MNWEKLGIFRNLNRFDVWQNIFEFLDVKSAINGLSKSCKSFKLLTLMHISHIKSICILALTLETPSSCLHLTELLKCEKTFLLKVISNIKSQTCPLGIFRNQSVVRLKYKSEDGLFITMAPLLESIQEFRYFTLVGNQSFPVLAEKEAGNMIKVLNERKIVFLKIQRVTLTEEVFKVVVKYIKEKEPMVIILDVSCPFEKAVGFQDYLSKLWKRKWLLTVNYKINGKILFNCTRDFLA